MYVVLRWLDAEKKENEEAKEKRESERRRREKGNNVRLCVYN